MSSWHDERAFEKYLADQEEARAQSIRMIESGIDLAQSLASYLHCYQLDKQGRPYIEHIRRVYNSCRSLSVEQRIAALLHDSLEDQNEKIDAHVIRTLFGAHVLEIVTALTRRHREDYEYYIRRVAECPDAILIKLADLNDNLSEERRYPGDENNHLRRRYLKAKEYLESCVAKGGTEK